MRVAKLAGMDAAFAASTTVDASRADRSRSTAPGRAAPLSAVLSGPRPPSAPEDGPRLYPGHRAGYLERFEAELDAAIAGGFLLAEDRAEILALAAASFRPAASPGVADDPASA